MSNIYPAVAFMLRRSLAESARKEETEPAPEPGADASSPSAVTDAVLDREEALQRVGGDPNLLRSLAAMFLESSPAQLAELREAAARGDLKAVRRLGHTLRGSVGIFGARAAFAAAEHVEGIAQNGNAADTASACAALENEVRRLRPALAALTAEGRD